MPPKHSDLNPFAPEFTPFTLCYPPSFFLPPPPSTEPLPPPPPPLHFAPFHHEILTYIPPINQSPIYTYYSSTSHRTAPQTAYRPPPPPPPPKPHRQDIAPRSRGVGESERGVSWTRSRAVKSGRIPNLKFVNRISAERSVDAIEVSRRDEPSPKSGKRHRVTPLKRDGGETTVLIKNVPYDCPRKELIYLLDEFCCLGNEKAKNEGSSKGEAEESVAYAYDFVYLPFDFRSKRSRGFAFVNFTNSGAARRFFDSFHGTKWGFIRRKCWHKIIEIVSAEIQGKEALVRHFTGSIFECETDDFLPASFTPPRDGSGQRVKLTVVGERRAPPPGAARPKQTQLP